MEEDSYKKMRRVADFALEKDIDINNLYDKLRNNEIREGLKNIGVVGEKNQRIALERSVLPIWNRGNIFIDGEEPGSGGELPLDSIRDFTGRVMIVRAGTGSGKSTQIPQALLSKGKVVMTQPRILTTVGIAERIADEMGVEIGGVVGYTTGGPKLKSKDTKLEIATEGIILLRPDDFFGNISYVILDEVHERSVNLDLLFVKLKQLLGKYSGLKVIIMSATLDPDKFKEYFGKGTSIIEIAGIPAEISLTWPEEVVDDYPTKIIETIEKIVEGGEDGNILVFLPTRAMIGEIQSRLVNSVNKFEYNHAMHTLFISALYRGIGARGEDLARLPLSELPEEKSVSGRIPTRKVILATNVAETGITLIGLKFVIDSGWTNRPYYNPYVDSNVMILDSITQGQALQRWGRVGRKAPGRVFPMYSKEQCLQMDNNDVNREIIAELLDMETVERNTNATGAPAVMTQNLDTFMLYLSVGDYTKVGLLDTPPSDSVARSLDTLWNLGAIDYTGKLSKLGEFMKKFKYPPKHSRMLFEAIFERCVEEIAIIISMILIGLDKLIDSNKFTGDCLMNQYYSDHVNLWFIYREYDRHRLDIKWCIDNGYNCSAFELIDDEVLNIKNTIITNKFPIFVGSEGLESKVQRIKNCVKAGLVLNVAHQNKEDKGIYISNRFPTVGGEIDRLSKAFVYSISNAQELFPGRIVYDSLSLIRNRKGFMQYKFVMATAIHEKE